MWKNVHPVQGAGFRTHDARIFCIRNECFLNGSFTASFYVFLHTVDWNGICWWLDSNHKSLVLEATALLYSAQTELIVLRWAIPCLFFLIFRLFCKQLTVNNNNDWIRTWILWNHWQLRHNQCSVVSMLPTLLRSVFTSRILFRTQTVLLVKFLPQIFTFNWNIS